MSKEILINVEALQTRVAILKDNELVEFFVERPTERPMAGNIYKGRVVSVVPGIQAAFVDVGMPKNGFLYISDVMGPAIELDEVFLEDIPAAGQKREGGSTIQDLVKKDQEVLVQIIKEPFSTKGARLSTHISLPGRYLVYSPTERHIGISRKIDDSMERIRLREMIEGLLGRAKAGLILRTAGIGKTRRDIYRDFKYLSWLWGRMKARANKMKAPALVHEEYDLVFRVIRDYLTEDIHKIVIDDKVQYRRAARFLGIVAGGMRSKLSLYSDDTPLFERRGIEKEINKIYQRKVELKSGGCIIIEPTESLVAIDVNTGRFIGKKSHEDTVYQTNLEAAAEIVRQIRLRDLGGIIVIDFIDMQLHRNRKSILAVLDEAMRRDKARYNIVGLSEIGLVEMTRQRIRKGIESVVYADCPYCGGLGKVASGLSVSIKIHELLEKHLKKTGARSVTLWVHPDIDRRLMGEDRSTVVELERHFKTQITIVPDAKFHLEEFKLS